MEMNYASNGKGNLGVTLGAIGTGLGVMQNGGILGNLFGNGCNNICSDNQFVTRYDAGKDARIAELETEVKLRDANIYTDSKLNDFRNYVDGKFAVVNDKLCAQAVHNATNDAVLGCMQGQIAQLMSLTALRIPNTSICPGWGDVTVTPAAAPAAATT